MPLPGQELSSIDFTSMIGGPLIAVVRAQAQSAIATVDFIKTVGFKPTGDEIEPGEDSGVGEPIYVSFKYPKELAPYQPAVAAVAEVRDADGNVTTPAVVASDAVPAVYETHELTVPILTMLPIPYIRIEEVTIDFNAKINSVEYIKTDSTFKISAELKVKHSWLVGSVKLKVNTSYQRNSQQGNTVNRTYSMAIHVRAVSTEMPAGMEKLLGILEDAITSTPAAA